MKSLIPALLLLLLPAQGFGEQPGLSFAEPGNYQLRVQPDLHPLRINKMHSWTLILQERNGDVVSGAELSIDGGMPAHDHGLATRPVITETDEPGVYLLEGIRFHMTGEWVLLLRIEEADGRIDEIEIRVSL